MKRVVVGATLLVSLVSALPAEATNRTLTLKPDNVSLKATVSSPRRKCLKAFVTVYDSNGFQVQSGDTNNNGVYRTGALAPGDYFARVFKDGHCEADRSNTATLTV